MNLRGMANRLTQRVNPNLPAQFRKSDGYSTVASGKPEPFYRPAEKIVVQMQALSKEEIKHLDALNISNAETSIYADRQLSGVDRVTGSGGDLIEFDDSAKLPIGIRGTTWLITAVLEGWLANGWCKAAATRQMPT